MTFANGFVRSWPYAAKVDPAVAKVMDLIDELAAKIVKEGEVEQKAYDEYLQWCQSAVQETGFAIETATKEKELMEVLSALERAISILEKEYAKNPASFAQIYSAKVENILHSLSLVADAAAFSVADKQRLMVLAQTDDDMMGAPAATVYKSQSGGIIDVLEDMKEKAESQLAELRKAEEASQHNFAMLKQSSE